MLYIQEVLTQSPWDIKILLREAPKSWSGDYRDFLSEGEMERKSGLIKLEDS